LAESATARASSASADEVGRLVSDMEMARRRIVSFVMDWGQPDSDATASDRDRHYEEKKQAYLLDISPMVVDIVTRSLALFGADPIAVALQQMAFGAEVNDPSRLLLAHQLQVASTVLGIR
jgi:hypothetical protein